MWIGLIFPAISWDFGSDSMNMMNWWRWNHEIRRWQTDDNFANSDPLDLKYICLDKLGSRLVQRTCSRCIWWRFSRDMMQDLSKTIWIQSFLDCIFIIRNGSNFIGCAWFLLYRMHISFESRAPIFMKLSSTLIWDLTICDVPIAIRLERRTVGTTYGYCKFQRLQSS